MNSDYPGLLPSQEQLLVLRASLLDGERALAAYQQWRKLVVIENDFDREVFRLVPLLYDNLRRLGVNDDLTGRLKGAYRMAWARNHKLFEETRPIVERLLAAGIPMMVVKGAPLALCYYGNVAVRPMSDVDIVVPLKHAMDAFRQLESLGYQPWSKPHRDLFRFRHAVQFTAPGPKEFDLHWHVLFDLPYSDVDDCFTSTAVPFEFLGHKLASPDATRMLLHSIVHGVRYNVEPAVRWIPDSLMVLRTAGVQIDWPWLLDFAVRRKFTHRLGLGLRYLAEEFGADVPPEVIRELSARPLSMIERIERKAVLAPVDFGTFLGPFYEAMSSFPRRPSGQSAAAAIWEFTHYLRVHWQLGGRSEIPRHLLSGLWRHVSGKRES